MLKPGLICNRQLVAIWDSFRSNNISLISSPIFSKHFCIYSHQTITKLETADEAMSSKKAKLSDSESASRSESSESESDSSTPPRKDAKSNKTETDTKTSSSASSKGNAKSHRIVAEKEPTWDLGSKKFLTVHDFKGKTYVNIREYYEKDGKVLPGKKGIALTIEQWQNLISSVDEVNQLLRK